MNKIEEKLKQIDQVIDNEVYKPNWKSLEKYPQPQWFKNAKLGIFSHWGVFSVPEFGSEWYPRNMYFKETPEFRHHKKIFGKDFQYRQMIEHFKGEKFDPEQWAALFKSVGADFFVPVGEHHDGFKLLKSEISEYNSLEMGMKRDVVNELKEKCERCGIVCGVSNHRAERSWFFSGMKTLNEKAKLEAEEFEELYGPCTRGTKLNFAMFYGDKGKNTSVTDEYARDWLAHVCDMIDNCKPSCLYFDGGTQMEGFRPYMKKMAAYYYNRCEQWGVEGCIMFKHDSMMYGLGVFDRERGSLSYTPAVKWQCDTSTAYNSWSYTPKNKWKSASELACTFLDVVSKNGALLLNVCPRADGSFCDDETQLLEKFGSWVQKYKPIIWQAEPYRVFGETKKQTKNGSFKEKGLFTSEDYRFLFNINHIYAFALKPNLKNTYLIKTMRTGNKDVFAHEIVDVKLVGSDEKVSFAQTNKGLKINVNTKMDTSMPICFDILID